MQTETYLLKSVGIEITWNCNQRCSYCYLACNSQENTLNHEMNLSDFEQILIKIWESGVREVYLIGGEPTVHSEFAQLIRLLQRYKWERTGICTNGVGISVDIQNLIKEYFDYVSVSVRGNRKTTNIITSVSVSFQDTFNFLKFLSKNKRNQILIGLDLLPQYFSQFNEVIQLLEDNHVIFDGIEIHRIAPVGGAKNADVLTPDQYGDLLIMVDKVCSQKGYHIGFEDALPLCLFDEKYWKYINTCRCGIDKIWIDPMGNARRCACSYGNIDNMFKSSLSDIWNSSI